jgi:hypothetical protein
MKKVVLFFLLIIISSTVFCELKYLTKDIYEKAEVFFEVQRENDTLLNFEYEDSKGYQFEIQLYGATMTVEASEVYEFNAIKIKVINSTKKWTAYDYYQVCRKMMQQLLMNLDLGSTISYFNESSWGIFNNSVFGYKNLNTEDKALLVTKIVNEDGGLFIIFGEFNKLEGNNEEK